MAKKKDLFVRQKEAIEAIQKDLEKMKSNCKAYKEIKDDEETYTKVSKVFCDELPNVDNIKYVRYNMVVEGVIFMKNVLKKEIEIKNKEQ